MKLVLEGRMEGKRPSGWPRMGIIDDLLDQTHGDMKRKAENRENWRIWKPRTCHLGGELMMNYPSTVLMGPIICAYYNGAGAFVNDAWW